jgi:Ca-activated chloride channel family protein
LLAPTDVTLPPLRVTAQLVDVEKHHQNALTTHNQTIHNHTSRRLEATYVFPLPENAELTNFQMSFNGKMVEGEVLPADKARQIYESIVRQTKDPGLIEFIGRRLLQMRVFPIEPGSDTKIQVKYQQVCKPVSGMRGYHYPLRTAKTASSSSGGGQAYGTVRFAVRLDTTAPLKNIWSPTHSVEIVRDGEHAAKIAYEASKGSLEEDFLLLYDTDSSDLGLSTIAYKPRDASPGHFVLTLTPKQLWPQQDYQPQDVVFVIDTSGSMSNEKIDQAKGALKFCIDKLDERDHFGIVRFSTGFDVLFEELAAATKEKRTEARTWIDKFSAAGGTNITDALKAALDMRPKQDGRDAASGRPFVIVFITDGQGNQPAEDTLKMVKGHPSGDGSRIFSFGVGHDVNTVFLDQLAIQHSGKPTYVQPGENLELVLGDFFSVISQPVLTNVKIALPDIGATEKFPATLGDLYHGQQLIIAGKFETPGNGAIKLTASRNGQPVEYTWPNVSFSNTAEAKYVPAIWAGRKIAYLIDQIRLHGENKEMVTEIVCLSQEYGIQTPYTSWLVNPEQQQVALREERIIMPMMRRDGGQSRGGGGGGMGGGGRGATASPAQQRDHLQGSGLGGYELDTNGGDFGALDLIDEEALAQDSGEAATELARKNAELRDKKSQDGDRVSQSILLTRKLGDRWYNRIGRFLVDEEVDEQTKLTVVRFGSNAYFEVVAARPELKEAFAASRNIVVKITNSQAIAISERAGTEEFSDQAREQMELAPRR